MWLPIALPMVSLSPQIRARLSCVCGYADRLDNGWSNQAPGEISRLAVVADVEGPSKNSDI